ncbi:YmfQ family protein [Anaeromassilibacillus senegalensis]|uniref:YmfQ family protein n=1 Tax=Anaeromassilibacillus senegalensis TaxID=1673717 RepID=UPI00068218B3|nr:YmfQ family protein [Anaeromassilibacillus senegalensis]
MKALKNQVPPDYLKSPETCATLDAMNPEAVALWEAHESLLDQLFVSTATWGLDFWEKLYGIETDISKPYDFRRSRVISKIRSKGTATIAMIKNAAESFVNGDVEIIEHPENYSFEVKFSSLGIPPNLEDLTATIEDIKPAHLAFSYIYNFLTHAGVSAYTHGQLHAYTHDQIRNGEMRE